MNKDDKLFDGLSMENADKLAADLDTADKIEKAAAALERSHAKFNDLNVCVTDGEGIVIFDTSISKLQKEWDDDPDFCSQEVTVKDFAEAVGDELSQKYYSKYGA